MRFLKFAFLACALFVLLSAPGFSSVTTYFDATSWLNGTDPGFSTVSLTGKIGSYNDTTGLQIPGGPEFIGIYSGPPPINSGNSLFVYSSPAGPYLTWSSFNQFITTSFLRIIFPAPVTSVSFDFYGAPNVYDVTVNHTDPFETPAAPSGSWASGFFGLTATADSPISVLDIALPSTNQNTPALNNLQYGTAALTVPPPDDDPQPAPEACTFIMIASGLIVLAKSRRHRTAAGVIPSE